MLLLGIRHRRQQKADCLLACAAMVLEYLGLSIEEERLRRILGTTDAGTPFPNIERLSELGLFVNYGKQGDLSLFERGVDSGLPVIVAVETLGWQHWSDEVTSHAVLVVGIDQSNGLIYLYDKNITGIRLEVEVITDGNDSTEPN